MKDFTIRPYCEETDFPSFYAYQQDLDSKTTAYLVRGASPCMPEDELRGKLQKQSRFSRYPFVVADQNGRAIGAALIHPYVRVSKHHTFGVILWEQPELMEQIVFQTLESIFNSSIVEMAVCSVPGYDAPLVAACSKLMKQVGCIPDYLVYEGKLYSEFTFILKRTNWMKLKL